MVTLPIILHIFAGHEPVQPGTDPTFGRSVKHCGPPRVEWHRELRVDSGLGMTFLSPGFADYIPPGLQ